MDTLSVDPPYKGPVIRTLVFLVVRTNFWSNVAKTGNLKRRDTLLTCQCNVHHWGMAMTRTDRVEMGFKWTRGVTLLMRIDVFGTMQSHIKLWYIIIDVKFIEFRYFFRLLCFQRIFAAMFYHKHAPVFYRAHWVTIATWHVFIRDLSTAIYDVNSNKNMFCCMYFHVSKLQRTRMHELILPPP